MSPRPSRAAERKPQILAAASRVIAERGLDGTRLADVAGAAGVSVGTVQHYFHTRSRLLMETFTYETEQAVDRWLVAGDGEPDGWAQVLALIDVVFSRRLFRERWTRWLEFWAAAARDPALRREMGEVHEHWRGPVRRAIEAGIRSGRFRPRLPLDDLVDRTIATFDGLALQLLLDAPGMTYERLRTLLVAGLADDLRVDPITTRPAAALAEPSRGSRSPARSSAASPCSSP
jgi:AcrR family transcriptional regulator